MCQPTAVPIAARREVLVSASFTGQVSLSSILLHDLPAHPVSIFAAELRQCQVLNSLCQAIINSSDLLFFISISMSIGVNNVRASALPFRIRHVVSFVHVQWQLPLDSLHLPYRQLALYFNAL